MPLEFKIDKSKITILTAWDNELGIENTFHLDVYSNKDEPTHASNGSFFKGSSVPSSWLAYNNGNLHCKFPERLEGPIYKRFERGKWSFVTDLKPLMVAELYGTQSSHLDPTNIAKGVIHFLKVQNPSMDLLVDAKPTFGFTKTYHSIWNIDMPREAIISAIDELLKDLIPPEHSNVVVRNYQEVGKYLFLKT